MSIIVTCSQCGRRLEAKEEWGGRRVKCPECGEAVTIPQGAGQPPQARPVRAAPAQVRPVQHPQSAQLPPAPGGGILDLLNDASVVPPAGPLSGSPLGLPPAKRRRKSGSNKTLFIAFSFAGVGLLVICCGIGMAFLGPAVEAGREAAIRVKARETVAKGTAIPVVLAPPPGATLAAPGPPSGPVWEPDARHATGLTTHVTFDRYHLRLPEGYFAPKPSSTAELLTTKIQTWVWASERRPSGHRSLCLAEVYEFSVPPLRFVGDLEAQCSQLMSELRDHRGLSEFQAATAERGQIDGKQFIRSRFSGVLHGASVNGFVLIALEGNRMLQFEGTSFALPGEPDFGLLEAAFLTFREQ